MWQKPYVNQGGVAHRHLHSLLLRFFLSPFDPHFESSFVEVHGASSILYLCSVFYRRFLEYNSYSTPNVESILRPICFFDALEKQNHLVKQMDLNLARLSIKSRPYDVRAFLLTSLLTMSTSFPIFAFLSMMQFLQRETGNLSVESLDSICRQVSNIYVPLT